MLTLCIQNAKSLILTIYESRCSMTTVEGLSFSSPINEFITLKKQLRTKLIEAGLTTVAQLMMLPAGALMQLKGVGPVSAAEISRELARHDLPQHTLYETMSAFVIDAFGDIDYAPAGVLNVPVVRTWLVSRPEFAPLNIVKVLENANPGVLVVDVLIMTSDDLFEQARLALSNEEFSLLKINEEIAHLALRLGYYGLSLYQEGVAKLVALNQ